MGRIKNGIFVLILLALFAGMAMGQVRDTTVNIDKGKPKDVGQKREYVTNKDSVYLGGVAYPANSISAQMVYDISPIKGRNMIEWRDTITSAVPFRTYTLNGEYAYVTITLTRGDTNKTNMDSIKAYSVDTTYKDTSQTGLRNLLTFTDGQVGIAGSSANSVVGYATQKYMLLDPICKFLHIRAVNAVLTNRIYILTIRAVRQ